MQNPALSRIPCVTLHWTLWRNIAKAWRGTRDETDEMQSEDITSTMYCHSDPEANMFFSFLSTIENLRFHGVCIVLLLFEDLCFHTLLISKLPRQVLSGPSRCVLSSEHS